MNIASSLLLLVFGQDPLIYSTYFGGALNESASVVRTDAAGDIYLAGASASDQPPFIPSDLPDRSSLGFVAKFNRFGALLWAKRFPVAEVRFMELSPAGGIYLVGRSISGQLPVTEGVLQPSQTAGGQYAMKLDASGAIEWATYLGNRGSLNPTATSVSDEGRLAVCGLSGTADIPLPVDATPFPPNNQSQPFCFVLAPGARFVEHSSILDSAAGVYVNAVRFRGEESIVIGGSLVTWAPLEGVEDARRSAFRLETDNATVTNLGKAALGPITSVAFSQGKLFLKSASALTTSDDSGDTLAATVQLSQDARQLFVHPLNPLYLCIGLNPLRCSSDGGATFSSLPIFGSVTILTPDPRQEGVFYLIANGFPQAISLKAGVRPPVLQPSNFSLSPATYIHAFDDGEKTSIIVCYSSTCAIYRDSSAPLQPLDTPERFNLIQVSKSNPKVWYAAHNFYGGNFPKIFRTADGGATWTPTSLSFRQMRGQIESLAIDPNNADRLAVLSTQGFWLSEDGGQQWLNLQGLFPNRSIAGFAFGPDSRIYAGSELLGAAFTSLLNIRENKWESPRVPVTAAGATAIQFIRPDGAGGYWLLGTTYSSQLATTEDPLLPDVGERILGVLIHANESLEASSIRLLPFSSRQFETDSSGMLAFYFASTPGGYAPPAEIKSTGTPDQTLDGFVLGLRPGESPNITWLPRTSLSIFSGFALLPDGQFVIAGSGTDRSYPVTPDAAQSNLTQPNPTGPPSTDVYFSIYRLP